ncbi:unnamed protein product, partial [Rangifer tarandus platyrhynchus]
MPRAATLDKVPREQPPDATCPVSHSCWQQPQGPSPAACDSCHSCFLDDSSESSLSHLHYTHETCAERTHWAIKPWGPVATKVLDSLTLEASERNDFCSGRFFRSQALHRVQSSALHSAIPNVASHCRVPCSSYKLPSPNQEQWPHQQEEPGRQSRGVSGDNAATPRAG